MTERQIRLFDKVTEMVDYFQSIIQSSEHGSPEYYQAIANRDIATSLYSEIANCEDMMDDYLEMSDNEWDAFHGCVGCGCLVSLTYDEIMKIGDFCDCEEEDDGECKKRCISIAIMFSLFNNRI